MDGLPEVTRVHAWLVVDDDGTEGVAGLMMPGDKTMTPMMCGDQPGAVRALNETADTLALLIGKPIRHYVFSDRQLIKEHSGTPRE